MGLDHNNSALGNGIGVSVKEAELQREAPSIWICRHWVPDVGHDSLQNRENILTVY